MLIRVTNGYSNVVTESGFQATSNRGLLQLRSLIAKAGADELRQRLRSYFHASKHLRLADSQKKLLTHMPPSLQGEVSWKIHQVPYAA